MSTLSAAPYLVGVDGGGTRTTLVLAGPDGREILRREGPAGLVDPRWPMASAKPIAALVREAAAEAGFSAPAAALCAGLAGVGNSAERDAVSAALHAQAIAERITVVSDGEIALDGALGSGAGVLLIAGTGSVAYARGERGAVERCGGWGMLVGDEGSGFGLGRAAVRAALRAADGRGAETALLPTLLQALKLQDADGMPPWVGRAQKPEIAALAVHVVRLAEQGDAVSHALLEDGAAELARHAVALAKRLEPWSGPIPVVFYGGLLGSGLYAGVVQRALAATGRAFAVRDPLADAVAGALSYARRMSRERAMA